MAQATETKIEVTTRIRGYRLDLTSEEASTLAQILSHIGGSPDRTARGIADGIADALREVGVVRSEHPLERERRSIYFTGVEHG